MSRTANLHFGGPTRSHVLRATYLEVRGHQRRVWESREQLHLAIITWIEHTYNNRPRQRRLGKLTPVEFELAFAATNAA